MSTQTTKNAIFFHAGCPVCVSAEKALLAAIDPSQYEVEVVHLGKTQSRLTEAENLGVKSVPALVLGHDVLHVNFGANLSDLK